MFIAIIIAIFEFIWKQRKLAVDENVSTFFFSEIHIHINIEYVESKIFTMKLKQLCVYKIDFLVEKGIKTHIFVLLSTNSQKYVDVI